MWELVLHTGHRRSENPVHLHLGPPGSVISQSLFLILLAVSSDPIPLLLLVCFHFPIFLHKIGNLNVTSSSHSPGFFLLPIPRGTWVVHFIFPSYGFCTWTSEYVSSYVHKKKSVLAFSSLVNGVTQSPIFIMKHI